FARHSKLCRSPPRERTMTDTRQIFQGALPSADVKARAAHYVDVQDRGTQNERSGATGDLTKTFYDLVTDFYEFGWGQSFHFAPIARGEEHPAAILRYEHLVALKARLEPGTRVLDVGCGVGGPMRAIARLTDARVTGINSNAYQVRRAAE